MLARACSTTRSAAAICSSSVCTSGSSAFSRASQLMSATSLSCNVNNASRSGCTLPPCRLNDSIGRPLGIALGGESLLFMREVRFLVIAGEGEGAIDALDFPIEATRLESIDGALEYNVGLIGAQPFGLQGLVGAGRCFIEPIGGVSGVGLEDRAVRLELELLAIHRLHDPRPPRFARHHQQQERFFRVGREDGKGREGTVRDGRLLFGIYLPLQNGFPYSRHPSY